MKDEDESWQSALSNVCDSKNLIKNVSYHLKQEAKSQPTTAHNVSQTLSTCTTVSRSLKDSRRHLNILVVRDKQGRVSIKEDTKA